MKTLLTIGHSTRPLASFVDLLFANQAASVVDVRTVPGSRHNPQFGRDVLSAALATVGLDYRHLKGLGGLRRARPDSPNGGWHNASFRGFADYMQTEDFARALAELEGLATAARTAILCAEAVPWRCHRSLIADALLVRGWSVAHIIDRAPPRPHRLTPFARIDGLRVDYPADE